MSRRRTPQASYDRRDTEIARLKAENARLREREAASRAEAAEARRHFSDLTAMSRRFASSMRAGVRERQESRRRLVAQLAVSRVLVEAQDLDEAAPRVFEIVGERLDWELGSLWRVDGDSMRLAGIWRRAGEPPGAMERASENMAFRRGEGLPGRVWERNEPVWVEDMLADGDFGRREAAAEDGLRGAFAFPIRDGGLVGVFEFFRGEVLSPDEDLMRTAAHIGERIGQLVERRRVEEAVLEAAERDRFRVALDDALRPLADPVDIQAEAMRVLGVRLGANRAIYADVEEDGDGGTTFAVVAPGYASGVPPLTGHFKIEDFGLARTAPSQAGTIVVADVASDPALTDDEKARYARVDIGAWVGVPLVKGDRFVAALGVHQREPRAWTPQEVALIEETAERAWTTVEHARAEEALRESEAKYHNLFDSIDEGFVLSELLFDDGKPSDLLVLETNPSFDRMMRTTDAVGKRASEIFSGAEESWFEAYASVDETGESLRFENYLAPLDSWFELYVSRVGGEGSNTIAIIFNDISERKRAETALRESEERFRLFVTAASEIVYRLSADWSEMRSLEGKSFLADTRNPSLTWLDEYIPHSDKTSVQAAIVEAVRTKTTFEMEHRVIRVDGTLGWAFSRAIPFLDERGEIVEWFGAASDITERKETEERQAFLLRLSDALRPLSDPVEIQETASQIVGEHLGVERAAYGEIEPDGETMTVERDWRRPGVPSTAGRFRMDESGTFFTDPMRAGRPATIEDSTTDPRIPPQVYAKTWGLIGVRSAIACPILKQGRFSAAFFVHDDRPRRWSDDEVALVSEVADRTWEAVQRARAEETLRGSEERLKLALDASAMGSFLYHVEEDRSESDARMLALFGLPEDGTLNLEEALARLIHPDDRAGYAEAVARAIGPGGDGTLREEIRVLYPNGVERSVAVTGRVRFEDGRAVRMSGVAADVTERRHAEEALRESEERFRALVGQGADMITISDRAGKIVYASPTTERVSGYTPEEFMASNPFGSIHPDDREMCEDALRRLVNEPGLSLDLRHRIRHKDGTWRWVEGTFTSLFHDPAIGGLVANVRDITARKQAEESLRESEERYRSLVTATTSIVWTAAPSGECVAPMPSWEEFTGQTFEEYRGFNWLDAVHPDDRPPMGTWDDLDPSEAPLVVEYRLRRYDGQYRRVVSRAVPVKDEDGEVREWVGTMTDVEEKRRAEEANAYLAEVVRSAGQAVIGLSPEGIIESWNPAAEKLYGYSAGEAVGQSISLIADPEQSVEQGNLMDVLKSGKAVSVETSRASKDGRRVEALVSISPVPGARGRIAGFSATLVDVTARKRAEEERDLSEAREIAARTAVEEAQRQLAFYAGAREERQVISRELHDRVAHSMAVVRQHLELYEVLAKRDPEAAGVKLEMAKEEAKTALNNTRDISMMLRHSEAEEGLEKALSGLLETTIPDGVRYEVEVDGDEGLVPTHVGNQLFLVLREAVRNAATHSGCERLFVGLKITPRRVEGRVEDDGEGFEPRNGDGENGLRQGGGLRSMRERADLVGGRLDAVSRPGSGTRIEVSVPLAGDHQRGGRG